MWLFFPLVVFWSVRSTPPIVRCERAALGVCVYQGSLSKARFAHGGPVSGRLLSGEAVPDENSPHRAGRWTGNNGKVCCPLLYSRTAPPSAPDRRPLIKTIGLFSRGTKERERERASACTMRKLLGFTCVVCSSALREQFIRERVLGVGCCGEYFYATNVSPTVPPSKFMTQKKKKKETGEKRTTWPRSKKPDLPNMKKH